MYVALQLRPGLLRFRLPADLRCRSNLAFDFLENLRDLAGMKLFVEALESDRNNVTMMQPASDTVTIGQFLAEFLDEAQCRRAKALVDAVLAITNRLTTS